MLCMRDAMQSTGFYCEGLGQLVHVETTVDLGMDFFLPGARAESPSVEWPALRALWLRP